jgi:hypothetical protein
VISEDENSSEVRLSFSNDSSSSEKIPNFSDDEETHPPFSQDISKHKQISGMRKSIKQSPFFIISNLINCEPFDRKTEKEL